MGEGFTVQVRRGHTGEAVRSCVCVRGGGRVGGEGEGAAAAGL